MNLSDHPEILNEEPKVLLHQIIETSAYRPVALKRNGVALRHTVSICMYHLDKTVFWGLSLEGCLCWRNVEGKLQWKPPSSHFGLIHYTAIKWIGEIADIVIRQITSLGMDKEIKANLPKKPKKPKPHKPRRVRIDSALMAEYKLRKLVKRRHVVKVEEPEKI